MKINAMAQEVAQTMMTWVCVCNNIYYTQTKIEIFLMRIIVCIRITSSIIMSHTIGVPTASTIEAIAAAKQNKTTLEMLLNLQKLVDEFKVKVTEMDEEMRTVKLENQILKNKINELTSSSNAKSSPSRRGFFGYGADEF
jgi:hypothetical protein